MQGEPPQEPPGEESDNEKEDGQGGRRRDLVSGRGSGIPARVGARLAGSFHAHLARESAGPFPWKIDARVSRNPSVHSWRESQQCAAAFLQHHTWQQWHDAIEAGGLAHISIQDHDTPGTTVFT